MFDLYNELTTEELETEFSSEKNRTRAKRRKTDIKKAIRKRHISKDILQTNLYNNLHEYSKNKIHCSCNLCRVRPNWDPDAKPIQDIKIIEKMDNMMDEYVKDREPVL